VLLHRLHYALPGWDATAESRDAQGEFHSAAQARAWADGGFDADHGFGFGLDGVSRLALELRAGCAVPAGWMRRMACVRRLAVYKSQYPKIGESSSGDPQGSAQLWSNPWLGLGRTPFQLLRRLFALPAGAAPGRSPPGARRPPVLPIGTPPGKDSNPNPLAPQPMPGRPGLELERGAPPGPPAPRSAKIRDLVFGALTEVTDCVWIDEGPNQLVR
jgi:hypothetical protein